MTRVRLKERHNQMERKRVGIVLFENIEVLDFCGPFEVFSVVRLNEERRREDPSPFEVLLVAEKNDPVVTTGGMKVIPDHTFDVIVKSLSNCHSCESRSPEVFEFTGFPFSWE